MFTDDDRAKVDAIYGLLFDDSDPTGREKPGNSLWKIKWMAAKQEEMQEDIDAIKSELGIGGTD